MLQFFEIGLNLGLPSEDNVTLWALGALFVGFVTSLRFIQSQHSQLIEQKNDEIKALSAFLVEEKDKVKSWEDKYMDLISEFNSIFQNQQVISEQIKNNGNF